ncbi:hypothetical protein EPUS_08835 [Endocarpon pusillum Z07020]|uniref:Uncharacterized protein n=1 Tax=Endocarpon pusillum (strain Z07020 / HMAS-L-300199) TaxID=1263415 RepID=U1GSP5_ENDPU|nr:uncharacterized protein EPUS_08835 [Endocarpon pusillum Z07020]ERF75021.1 hypothetical protein EPUS_08835 [Endocarpon pusillum Z07020]
MERTPRKMFSNPTSQLPQETFNPSMHEINTVQSSAAEDESVLKTHRRAEYSEPLLKKPQNDDLEEALQAPQHISWAYKSKQINKKLGLLSMVTLVIGTLVILASLLFVSFLWLSDVNNRTWQVVASRNWMTRCVSLTALALRTTISMQAMISTSMLAGLALERKSVLSMHLASTSAMRNINNGPLYLAWCTSKALLKMEKPWKQIFLPSILILLFVTTFLSQFTSTILLSDLSLTPVLGLPTSTTLSSHFIYNTTDEYRPLNQITRGSSWLRLPAFYPAFAEYSNPETKQDPAVVDTGPILRAFLPLGEQQSRQEIGDYKGVATVLDSRVICVRPELENPKLQINSNGDSPISLALVSSISASSSANGVLRDQSGIRKREYGCLVDPPLIKTPDNGRGITLCQVMPIASDLPSQMEIYYGVASGLTYLVLNATTSVRGKWWDLVFGSDLYEYSPVSNEINGEWIDLLFTDDGTMRISASLCYAASDTADLFIRAYSGMNRTEPLAEFDTNISKYRYDAVRNQLGQRKDGSWTHGMFSARGILQLEPRPSWSPGTHPEDYVRPWRSVGLSSPYISWVNNAARFEYPSVADYDPMNLWPPQVNYTAYLGTKNSGVSVDDSPVSGHNFSSIHPDPSFPALLQEILQHGGDIAHALSSLLTVLAASTYYDQLPQFNGQSEVEQTFFEPVLTPQTYRGYSFVMAVASTHLILLATILFQFLTGTKISSIGNAWQTFAQIKDPLTEELLDFNTLPSDEEVRRWMKRNADAKVSDRVSDSMGTFSNKHEEHAVQSALQPNDLVGIRLASSGTRTELARRQRAADSKLSHDVVKTSSVEDLP